jgi:hypothetical protein
MVFVTVKAKYIMEEVASSLIYHDEMPKNITERILSVIKNFHHESIFRSVTRRKIITKQLDPHAPIHAGS